MVYAKDVIRILVGEVGYREKGENHTKYAAEVKSLNWAQDQPWCHTFISWGFQKAEARDLAPCTASCAAGVQWFKRLRMFSSTPRVGDIVYYGQGGGTHVELVTEVTATDIKTVGGNTSGKLEGRFFNGDGVYEKWVPRNSSRIHGYGRPDYDVPKSTPPVLRKGMKGPAVRTWQKTLVGLGYDDVKVDGVFGPLTVNATAHFQESKGIEIDGIVGPVTRSKV